MTQRGRERAASERQLRLYVGNLPFSASAEEVRRLFAEFGPVSRVSLVTDRDSGKPRGFGFVDMAAAPARQAIARLDGSEWRGRLLRVNEARRRPTRAEAR